MRARSASVISTLAAPRLSSNCAIVRGPIITLVTPGCHINHANAMDEAYEVSRRVPGWKMYPDIKAGQDGRSDADLDELAGLGFNFVTSHAAMKGATKGMLDYHRRNIENRNTVYSETDDFGIGLTIHPYTFEDWVGRARDLRAYQAEVRTGAGSPEGTPG